MFEVKILADSVTHVENRLTTMSMTYPRFVHSEHLRHRMFSFNAASSRAIPVEKMIEQVMKTPVVPIHWGKAQKGMQAYEEMSEAGSVVCETAWMMARRDAVHWVKEMLEQGLHKQIANRLLEPWMWSTVIVSGTDGAWKNFFALRCHPEAEPHIRKIAEMAREALNDSVPKFLNQYRWHLPLIGFEGDDELTPHEKVRVSVGRCARVSYLTHEGIRDVAADMVLHDRLMDSKHFSPFEHVAQADAGVCWSDWSAGNFGEGWSQYRKTILGEYQNGKQHGC